MVTKLKLKLIAKVVRDVQFNRFSAMTEAHKDGM